MKPLEVTVGQEPNSERYVVKVGERIVLWGQSRQSAALLSDRLQWALQVLGVNDLLAACERCVTALDDIRRVDAMLDGGLPIEQFLRDYIAVGLITARVAIEKTTGVTP